MARPTAPTAAKGKKKPVWKEVEEQEAGRVANRVRASRTKSLRRRYAVVHDTDGPRVRIGILWFVLALAALAVGPLPAAVVYGGAAAVAAAQTARCWRKRRQRPNAELAAGMAALMGLGACFGAGGAGVVILVGVGLTYLLAASEASPNPTVVDAGFTLQCALPPGAVALSMVLLARLDQGSAIALLLLVSAYEVGDFLVGSGARNPYEGPAAGASAVVVVTFIVSTLPISTLSFGEAWLFGGLVMVLAPLGQLLASAILPTAASPALALRRLDSLLLVAPIWCFGVGLIA
jgi:hypothetical protein